MLGGGASGLLGVKSVYASLLWSKSGMGVLFACYNGKVNRKKGTTSLLKKILPQENMYEDSK